MMLDDGGRAQARELLQAVRDYGEKALELSREPSEPVVCTYYTALARLCDLTAAALRNRECS